MVRVPHQKSTKQTIPANGIRSSKVAKQRKNHKVVIESDAQDKENARAVLSFRAEPPPGYTFIPAGNPQLTSALKEFAKRGNHQILAVTTTPHAARHELSREVHRIGFHFPTEVVAQVCNHYGIRLTSGGKLVEEKDDDKLFMRLYQKGQLALDEQVRDQVTINTEAKQIIQDLFPKIPDNDLFQIIKTAFQLGDGKVGTADEIPLVRRAQLSVVAHIRHTYTSYDKLLRSVPYSEARHKVESITLQKLIDWRGDDQDDKQAMDDTLREVVVISDEDTDEDVEEGQVLENRDLQVQPISATGRPILATGASEIHASTNVHSDDEEPKGYRYLPQVVRRYPIQDPQAVTAARQQSRYAVWDRVRQEYRGGMIPQQSRVVERVRLDEPPVPSSQTSYVVREPVYIPEPSVRRVLEPVARVVSQQALPTYVRGADGKLYEKVTNDPETVTSSAAIRKIFTPPPPDHSRQYTDSRHMSPRMQTAYVHRRTESFEVSDGTILPSIESPHSAHPLSGNRRNPFEEPRPPLNQRRSGLHELNQRQASIIDLTNDAEQASKRRRTENAPPSPYFMHHAHNDHDYDHDKPQADVHVRFMGNAQLPQQQRLIPLDNPPAEEHSHRKVYERPDLRRQSTVIYREEIANREVPSPRETSINPFPPTIIHAPYYTQPPQRLEHTTNVDQTFIRPYSESDHRYLSYDAVHSTSERVSRVVIDDPPLLGQSSNHYVEASPRHLRLGYEPFSVPSQSQRYVPSLQPVRSREDYTAPSTSNYVASNRQALRMPFPSNETVDRLPKAAQPSATTYRNGENLRTTYVQN